MTDTLVPKSPAEVQAAIGYEQPETLFLGFQAAANGYHLCSLGTIRDRPVVSVLLDGDHRDQTRLRDVQLPTYNPFWVRSPTLHNIEVLLFQTNYPRWLMITMGIAVASTLLSVSASVLCAYAIERLKFRGAQHVGLAIYLAYLVPPSILFIPLATLIYQFGLFDNPVSLILTYPTFLVPFCTWLLIGYFKSIPYELEECALIDGASRCRSSGGSRCLGGARTDLGGHFRLHPFVERIHLCIGLYSVHRQKTVQWPS